jgi:hypothetical protein
MQSKISRCKVWLFQHLEISASGDLHLSLKISRCKVRALQASGDLKAQKNISRCRDLQMPKEP